MTYVAPVPVYAILRAANWTRSNSCSGMFPFRLQSAILAANRDCTTPSTTVLALSQMRAANPQGGGLLAPWRLLVTYLHWERLSKLTLGTILRGPGGTLSTRKTSGEADFGRSFRVVAGPE